jgi:hypothetical protein
MGQARMKTKLKNRPRQRRNARFTLSVLRSLITDISQPKKKKKSAPVESTSVFETLSPDVSPPKESAKQSRTTTSVPAVRNEKKALKKAKAKEKKAVNDELDQALAELSIQYGFYALCCPNQP